MNAQQIEARIDGDFADWLSEAKRIARPDFAELAEHYSFRAAFDEGMTPAAAVKDCREWLAA